MPAPLQHIARECGILTEGGLALEGPDFRRMPEEELLPLLPKLQVRAAPCRPCPPPRPALPRAAPCHTCCLRCRGVTAAMRAARLCSLLLECPAQPAGGSGSHKKVLPLALVLLPPRRCWLAPAPRTSTCWCRRCRSRWAGRGVQALQAQPADAAAGLRLALVQRLQHFSLPAGIQRKLVWQKGA